MRDLTKAFIKKKKYSESIDLNITLNHIQDLQEYTYLLIIKSATENCTRLTIYPIKRENIIKISLSGSNISGDMLANLSKILQDFDIIHTSGLLLKEKELFYECYLNLSQSDIKTKDLKTSLDKIRIIFKEIKIEEIGLIKSKKDKI